MKTTLNIALTSKPIEPFQYPYYRIYWNGSCYVEDTVEDKSVSIDVNLVEGWNSCIFEVIDVFDVFDPLDGKLVAQTFYDILDLKINNTNSWPVATHNGQLSGVKFHSDHATWYSSRGSDAKVQGKVSDMFCGKGFTELRFCVKDGQIVDHYYANRNQINFYHWLSHNHIQSDCYSTNLFGLSNARLKDLFTTSLYNDENTYEKYWGGRAVTIDTQCQFKDKLAQWISARPWPFRWIHAEYFNKRLPEHLAHELLTV